MAPADGLTGKWNPQSLPRNARRSPASMPAMLRDDELLCSALPGEPARESPLWPSRRGDVGGVGNQRMAREGGGTDALAVAAAPALLHERLGARTLVAVLAGIEPEDQDTSASNPDRYASSERSETTSRAAAVTSSIESATWMTTRGSSQRIPVPGSPSCCDRPLRSGRRWRTSVEESPTRTEEETVQPSAAAAGEQPHPLTYSGIVEDRGGTGESRKQAAAMIFAREERPHRRRLRGSGPRSPARRPRGASGPDRHANRQLTGARPATGASIRLATLAHGDQQEDRDDQRHRRQRLADRVTALGLATAAVRQRPAADPSA